MIFLPFSLYNISEKISVIGLYHTKESEEFPIRFRKMVEANYSLSFPFIISIFVYVKSTVPAYNTIDLLYLSIGITLIALLGMRLLANPSKLIKPRLCKLCPTNQHDKIIEIHKERIISFFYSFICAIIILIIAYWTNFIILNEKLLDKINNHFSSIGYEQALIALTLYVIFLVLITFVGEVILFITKPIIQTPHP